MSSEKETNFSFDESVKESISTRIRQLIGTRTVRAAARAWGLSFSTLNNYLTRGTEPSLNVALKIANVEGVSVEWLATGVKGILIADESDVSHHEQKNGLDSHGQNSTYSIGYTATPLRDERFMALTWTMFFEALNSEEKSKLIDTFAKLGAKGVLALLNNVNESTIALLELSQEEQMRLLRLNEQLKKGSPEAGEDVAKPGPSSSSKKAS
ncbi:helix-turn-helix transcriptional regulator [Klebsiella pneumoniae]|uniref:helix-turn-helix domain-containing protein n=1 Tax=Klebsiella pneumoniae TaxID=573 RepID=UPI002936E379|nr:helix-turn-helix transcriptional regulator [Klebsiella pneumoniae]WOD90936.1 helix-turn-helix transcriptional regulator [Klebsiella pneumoniae]